MPFTFSHPAAVLPIHSVLKKWIALPALAIGSMVPDAAYYLPMPEHFKESSHTVLGTFSSSLPLGILVLLFFYWIGEETVFLLPSPHREALQGRIKIPAPRIREVLLVVAGIVLGAWTHVVWDWFTHDEGWAAQRVRWLDTVLLRNRVPGFNTLQLVSTLFGLCVLLYVYSKWMRSRGFRPWKLQRPTWRLYLWLGVFATCFAEAAIESHAIQAVLAMTSPYFLHIRHAGLLFVTNSVRNVLVAVFAVSLGAKGLGLYSPSEARQETTP